MYIGLDLGTSGLKGIVLSGDQGVDAEAHAPLTVSRRHPGWSEQDPHDWLMALDHVMQSLAQQVDMGAVRAIGLAGQMHGATFLGDDDAVLYPCILWNDTRAVAEASALDAIPAFRALTGNIVFPGFTAPKAVWLRDHEPELFKRVAKVLLPKDFLRLHLTGAHIADMSDAAGTAWLDVGARDWADDLLAHTGLSRDAMPRLIEGTAVGGRLRDTLAAAWGLPKGLIVAGGGGDNAASAVGVGVTQPGQAFVSLGTSGVLFAACDAYRPDAASAVHTFCHALPNLWHQMGVILAAGDALNWWAGVLGQSPAAITKGLRPLQPPGQTLFLPYLGGERTPHNNARVRGQFMNLGHQTDSAALTRSVLEGIAFALRDSLDVVQATGTQVTQLIGVGGGIRSDYWVEAVATALNIPIEVPVAGDFGGAFGAARLAMMADGAGVEVATVPQISHVVAPNSDLVDAYSYAHQRYNAAYLAVKELS